MLEKRGSTTDPSRLETCVQENSLEVVQRNIYTEKLMAQKLDWEWKSYKEYCDYK